MDLTTFLYIVCAVIALLFAKDVLFKDKTQPIPIIIEEEEQIEPRDYSLEELEQYDGQKDKHIFVSVKGIGMYS